MDYNLNQGQKEAADAFFDFLLSEATEFIISGPAGVGKTYLMNYIIDNTMPRYVDMCQMINIDPKYFGVTMTATTNKAAEVLGKATKRPTQTIHSFLGLIIKNDYSTGKSTLEKNHNWKIHRNLIIFIDECSMIDTDLLNHIHNASEDCKIVYVGDHCQLAPVQEVLSPVYARQAPFYALTQPMRNAGQPALGSVCKQLRGTVEDGIFWPIHVVPGVIDHLGDADMQTALKSQFKDQTHEARILAYTNKRVNEYNDYIRNERTLPNEFQVGEFLINNNSFKWGKHSLPVESEIEITKNTQPISFDIDSEYSIDITYIDFEDSYERLYQRVPVPLDKDYYNQLVKYYAKKKMWDVYFRLKNDFADLRPRDAATVHKSQGSTYETVFIDLGDISGCYDASQAARLLYVAFSRARSRVVLYGNLSNRFGGLVK